MKPARARLVVLVPALMLLCYVVPYLLLDDLDAWYGSALFWTVTAATVIAINAVVSSTWRD